jgi:hypothetical protein
MFNKIRGRLGFACAGFHVPYSAEKGRAAIAKVNLFAGKADNPI